MSHSVPSTVVKTYPARGPLQQFRFSEGTAFVCFRCGQAKVSKLLAIYEEDWARRLCNGCYGRLLSLYDIKAGVSPDSHRADALASVLLETVDAARQREAELILRAGEARAELLTPEAVRFLATAEYVAGQLADHSQLEWSPAVIGLCKAFEIELVSRILRPLVAAVSPAIVASDRNDKDLGRIATFCAQPGGKPPELGALGHFLQTAIHSVERRQTSPLIRSFLSMAKGWTGSSWILDPQGCTEAISTVTTGYRNPAAHIAELSKADYLACRELLIGSQGVLWRLVLSTTVC